MEIEGPNTLVSVLLIPKAARALEAAADLTGFSKTDTVNRALQLYHFLMLEQAAGHDLVIQEEAKMKGLPFLTGIISKKVTLT